MKRLFLFLFVLFSNGCGFITTEDPYDGRTVDAPDIDRTDDGMYIYSSPAPQNSLNSPVAPQICEYSSNVLKTITRKVKTGLVTGINKTIEKTYTFELDLNSDVDQALLKADHIHLKNAQLRLDTDYSFSTLDFIDWIKTDLNNQRVLWTDNPDGIHDQLQFDGSIDIRPEIIDDKITFQARVRGSLPDKDVYLKIILEFVTVRECESMQ